MDTTPKNASEVRDMKHHTNVTDTMRKIDSGPSTQNTTAANKPKQVPVDLVEEELMESFPASDPPGHSHRNRPEPTRPGHAEPDAEVPSDQPLQQAP